MGTKSRNIVKDQNATKLKIVAYVCEQNMVSVTTQSEKGRQVTQRLMYQPALIRENSQPTTSQRALVKAE